MKPEASPEEKIQEYKIQPYIQNVEEQSPFITYPKSSSTSGRTSFV